MTEWDRLVGEPLAPFVGPFPHRQFLEVCASNDGGEVRIISDGSNAMALVVCDGVARFVGDHRLTDYHSPLGTETRELVALLVEQCGAVRFELDSLPMEAASPLAAAFEETGRSVVWSADEPCRVLELGAGDSSAWESSLRSKDRHELRRKRRRYHTARGEPEVVAGAEHFDAFVALHRMSHREKGDFMTDQMEAFFSELLCLPTARLDVLQHDGTVEAAAFGFDDDEGFYLYNSAYDTAMADLSPGIVLIDRLIVRSLTQRKGRFDFLKGTEPYKRRLGAQERPLFRLEVSA